MDALMKVPDEWTLAGINPEPLRSAQLELVDLFPETPVTFYYYIKPSEESRYFVIRVKTRDQDAFNGAARRFAHHIGCQYVPYGRSRALIDSMGLDSFV